MKQTAVELLVKGLPMVYWEDPYYSDLLEQAKEMEKQQIIDALKEGVNFEIDNSHSTPINYKKHFKNITTKHLKKK
jgi:hypothetical protein